MTRDEAIHIFRTATPDPSSLADGAWIDRFVALGMLTLDEPRSAEERARDVLKDIEKLSRAGIPFDAFRLVDAAGLKIVEK